MIYNLTPHDICIFSKNDVDMSNPRRLFIKEGAQPSSILPSSGIALNAQLERIETTPIPGLEGVPVIKQVYTSVDSPFDFVPQATPQDWFIVSALYRTAAIACGHSLNLLTVDSVVYDAAANNPRPVGCLGLSK